MHVASCLLLYYLFLCVGWKSNRDGFKWLQVFKRCFVKNLISCKIAAATLFYCLYKLLMHPAKIVVELKYLRYPANPFRNVSEFCFTWKTTDISTSWVISLVNMAPYLELHMYTDLILNRPWCPVENSVYLLILVNIYLVFPWISVGFFCFFGLGFFCCCYCFLLGVLCLFGGFFVFFFPPSLLLLLVMVQTSQTTAAGINGVDALGCYLSKLAAKAKLFSFNFWYCFAALAFHSPLSWLGFLCDLIILHRVMKI